MHYGELCNYFILYHNVIIIKYTINLKCLNHSPTLSVKKLSSTNPVPGAKKVGDHSLMSFP